MRQRGLARRAEPPPGGSTAVRAQPACAVTFSTTAVAPGGRSGCEVHRADRPRRERARDRADVADAVAGVEHPGRCHPHVRRRRCNVADHLDDHLQGPAGVRPERDLAGGGQRNDRAVHLVQARRVVDHRGVGHRLSGGEHPQVAPDRDARAVPLRMTAEASYGTPARRARPEVRHRVDAGGRGADGKRHGCGHQPTQGVVVLLRHQERARCRDEAHGVVIGSQAGDEPGPSAAVVAERPQSAETAETSNPSTGPSASRTVPDIDPPGTRAASMPGVSTPCATNGRFRGRTTSCAVSTRAPGPGRRTTTSRICRRSARGSCRSRPPPPRRSGAGSRDGPRPSHPPRAPRRPPGSGHPGRPPPAPRRRTSAHRPATRLPARTPR